MDNRISGADEPRAIKVKLATVGFQTATFFSTTWLFSSNALIQRVSEVILSIAFMKISEMIEMPKKSSIKIAKYKKNRAIGWYRGMPGPKTQL